MISTETNETVYERPEGILFGLHKLFLGDGLTKLCLYQDGGKQAVLGAKLAPEGYAPIYQYLEERGIQPSEPKRSTLWKEPFLLSIAYNDGRSRVDSAEFEKMMAQAALVNADAEKQKEQEGYILGLAFVNLTRPRSLGTHVYSMLNSCICEVRDELLEKIDDPAIKWAAHQLDSCRGRDQR